MDKDRINGFEAFLDREISEYIDRIYQIYNNEPIGTFNKETGTEILNEYIRIAEEFIVKIKYKQLKNK